MPGEIRRSVQTQLFSDILADEAKEEPKGVFRCNLFGSEECYTPSKEESKMHTEEKEADEAFISTVSVRKARRNHLDAMPSFETTDGACSNHSSAEYASFGPFRGNRQTYDCSSRFKSDYEGLEVLGSGHFGTVYKRL